MHSIMDSMVTIDSGWGAITIVARGQHAGLIIEMVHPTTQEIEIQFTDFNPKVNLVKALCEKAGFSPDDIKSVRKSLGSLGSDFLINFFVEPREGVIDYYHLNMSAPTKKALFDDQGLNGSSETFKCELDKIRMMIQNIRTEADAPPLFQIRGSYANKKSNVHSCITWALEKLKIAGVEHDPNLIEKLSSTPTSYHLESSSASKFCTIS